MSSFAVPGRSSWLIAHLSCFLFATGCAGGSGDPVPGSSGCRAGDSYACTCDDGTRGARICGPDGEPGECVCATGRGPGGPLGASGSAGVATNSTASSPASLVDDGGTHAPDLGGADDPVNQGDGGTSSCPAAYECQPDPLLGALMYCGMPGELVPPECVTDEDCVRVGLPGATCLVQDDFGISGCLKTCT